MAKRKVVKKSTKPKQAKCDCTTGEIFGTVAFIALILGFILYMTDAFPSFISKPEIESGQCYLDRAYVPLKVVTVWSHDDSVWFKEMEVRSIESSYEGAFYLTEKGDRRYDRERTVEFVEKNYTLIPCKNLYIRE